MNRDYHAMLTLYGFPKLDKKTRKRVVKWLRDTASFLEAADKDVSSKRFIARLMK